jgi:5-formyltetrahydrofolate cyclo-ligase
MVRVPPPTRFAAKALLRADKSHADEQTTIATTVHRLQVVDAELPESGHDFRVDLIVTPWQGRAGTRASATAW